ncbi:MAG: hypothetical protein ACFCUI_00425 [Bernardetiaceae bacterium]
MIKYLFYGCLLAGCMACAAPQPILVRGGAVPPPREARPPTPEEFARLSPRLQQKWINELSHPQYTDPLYFGHRHSPKKRPIQRQTDCTVCGMRH